MNNKRKKNHWLKEESTVPAAEILRASQFLCISRLGSSA
jgi:hypothetical protein